MCALLHWWVDVFSSWTNQQCFIVITINSNAPIFISNNIKQPSFQTRQGKKREKKRDRIKKKKKKKKGKIVLKLCTWLGADTATFSSYDVLSTKPDGIGTFPWRSNQWGWSFHEMVCSGFYICPQVWFGGCIDLISVPLHKLWWWGSIWIYQY